MYDRLMEIVTVSSRFQVVIPRSVREAMGLRPGEKLMVEVQGDRILMRPRPSQPARALRGMHRDIWCDVDPVEYVRRERESWGS